MFLPNRSAKAFLLVLLVCLSAACSKETEQAIPLLQVTSPIPSPSPRGVAERQQENQQQSGGKPRYFASRNNGIQKTQSEKSIPFSFQVDIPLKLDFSSAPALAEAKSQFDTTRRGACGSEVFNESEISDAKEEFFDAYNFDDYDESSGLYFFNSNSHMVSENQLGEDRTDAGHQHNSVQKNSHWCGWAPYHFNLQQASQQLPNQQSESKKFDSLPINLNPVKLKRDLDTNCSDGGKSEALSGFGSSDIPSRSRAFSLDSELMNIAKDKLRKEQDMARTDAGSRDLSSGNNFDLKSNLKKSNLVLVNLNLGELGKDLDKSRMDAAVEPESQLGEDRTDAGATVLKQEKLFDVGGSTDSITKNKRFLILSNIDNSKNHIDPDFIAWFKDLLERAISDGNISMDYIGCDRALILFKYIETYGQDSSYLEKLNGRYNSYEYFKLKLYVDKESEFALFVLMELSPFSFTDHSIESVIFYFGRDYIKIINPSSVNDKQSSELSSSAVLDLDKIVNFYKSLVKYNDPQPEENQFEKAARRIQAQFRGYKSREGVSNLFQCYELLSNFFKTSPILENFENYLNENVTSSKVLLEIVRILYDLTILEESSDFKKSLESMHSIASDNHKKRTFKEIESHPLQSVEDEFGLKESKGLKESIHLSFDDTKLEWPDDSIRIYDFLNFFINNLYKNVVDLSLAAIKNTSSLFSSSSAAVASDRIINSFSVQEGQENDLDADNFQVLSGFEGSDVIDNQDNLKGQSSEDNSRVESCYTITRPSQSVIVEHDGLDKCNNNYCKIVKTNKKCDKSVSNNQLVKAETDVDDQENPKGQTSENYSKFKSLSQPITCSSKPRLIEHSELDKCNNSSHVMSRINNNCVKFVSNDHLIKAETDVDDQDNPKGQTSENYSKVKSLSHPKTSSSGSDNLPRVMPKVKEKFEYELKSIENFTPSEIPSEELLEQPLFYFENLVRIDSIQEIEKNNSAVTEKKALQKNFKILIKCAKPREKLENDIKNFNSLELIQASKQASVPMPVLETDCINFEMFSDSFKIEENSEKNFRPSIHQNIEQSENSSQAVAVQSISQDINQDSLLNEELQSEQFIKPVETNDYKTSESMNQDDLELDSAEISLLETSYKQKVDAWLSEINESENITNDDYGSFPKDKLNEYFLKITIKIDAEIQSIENYSDTELEELIENYSLLNKHFKSLYLICKKSTHYKSHAEMFKLIDHQFDDVLKILKNVETQEDVKKAQEDTLVKLKKIISSLLETAKQGVLEVKKSFQSKLQVKKSNNQEDKILSTDFTKRISQYIEEVLDDRVTSSLMYAKDNSKIHYYAMNWVIKQHFNDKKNDISNEPSNLFDTVDISTPNIDLILEEECMNAFFDNISTYIKKHNEMDKEDKDSTVKCTYIMLKNFFEWIKTEYKCSDYSYESSTLDKIIDKFNQEIESQKNRSCLSKNNSLFRTRNQNNFETPERRDANSDDNSKIDVETKKDGNKEEKKQATKLQSFVDSCNTIISIFSYSNKKLKKDDFTECDVEENSTFDASSLADKSTSQYSYLSSIRKRK